MALIWFDGFDHYGLDETKLTEGPYDQADAAFTLSEANPRTGNRCLRRDSSTSDNQLKFDLGSEKETVGVAGSFYIDILPENEGSYKLASLLDENSVPHISAWVSSVGNIVLARGGSLTEVVSESLKPVIYPGRYFHFEWVATAQPETTSAPNLVESFNSGLTPYSLISGTSDGFSIVSDDYGSAIRCEPTTPVAAPTVISRDLDSTYEVATVQLKAKLETHSTPHPNGEEAAHIIFTSSGSGVFGLLLEDDATSDGPKPAIPLLQVGGAEYAFGSEPLDLGIWYQLDGVYGNGQYTFTLTNLADMSIFGIIQLTSDAFIVDGINFRMDYFAHAPNNIGGIGLFDEIYINSIEIGPGSYTEVRINGVTVIANSDAQTISTNNDLYRKCSLHCGSGFDHGVTTDIDDFFIWDDSGAWNNSFLGDRRVFPLSPNQDTNIADFEPSEGSFGYKMIDEDSPDGDSTFILAEADLLSGSPLSGTSEFQIENLVAGVSSISALNVVTRASKTDETSADLSTSINSGSNSVSSAAHTLTTSYQYYSDVYEYDPATIANLTRDGVNSLSVSVTAEDLDSGEESPGEESPGEEIAVPWGSRAVFGGGFTNVNVNTIDYIEISTPGNAVDFGDLTVARRAAAAASDGSRAVSGGGFTTVRVNTIDYVEIATPGNAVDFGDLTQTRWGISAASDGSRAVFGGGFTTVNINTIDYVEIATPGNAVDFGDLTQARNVSAGASDGSRAVFGGGLTSISVDTIDYVEIATPGNAVDFGNLTQARHSAYGTSGG